MRIAGGGMFRFPRGMGYSLQWSNLRRGSAHKGGPFSGLRYIKR